MARYFETVAGQSAVEIAVKIIWRVQPLVQGVGTSLSCKTTVNTINKTPRKSRTFLSAKYEGYENLAAIDETVNR